MEKGFKNHSSKILITGPESTGKSAMTSFLANYYQGLELQEYARSFLEKYGKGYTYETVIEIAKEQLKQRNLLLKEREKSVFFDTDLLVCRIWLEHVYGRCPDWIIEASKDDVFDHILLMDIDLAWEEDPLREHPKEREELFNRYKEALEASGRSFSIIGGKGDDRYERAKQIIDAL